MWDDLFRTSGAVSAAFDPPKLIQESESLVLPSAHAMCSASQVGAVTRAGELGPVKAFTGLGIALVGCLDLSLLPFSPDDTWLGPALEKVMLE